MNLEDDTFKSLVDSLVESFVYDPFPRAGRRAGPKCSKDPWEALARDVEEDLAALEAFRSKIRTRAWGFIFVPFTDEFHYMLRSLRDAARNHDPSVQDLIDEAYGGDSHGR